MMIFWNVQLVVAACIAMMIRLNVVKGFVMIRLMTVRIVVIRLMMVDLRVVSVTDLLDDSIESMPVIVVLHNTFGSISFIQSVFSDDLFAISVFPLTFVIAGVWILYSVVELVLGVRMIFLMVIRCVT